MKGVRDAVVARVRKKFDVCGKLGIEHVTIHPDSCG